MLKDIKKMLNDDHACPCIMLLTGGKCPMMQMLEALGIK